MGKLGDAVPTETLARLVADEDAGVRVAAVIALRALNDKAHGKNGLR